MGRRLGTYEAVGRRMRMTKSDKLYERALDRKISAAHDWLHAANRAMSCVIEQPNRGAGTEQP